MVDLVPLSVDSEFTSKGDAHSCLFPHALGGGLNGFQDILVARAAAGVPGNRFADLWLGRVRVLGQEMIGREQQAWGAVATLQPVVIGEGLLERMQVAVLLEAL